MQAMDATLENGIPLVLSQRTKDNMADMEYLAELAKERTVGCSTASCIMLII